MAFSQKSWYDFGWKPATQRVGGASYKESLVWDNWWHFCRSSSEVYSCTLIWSIACLDDWFKLLVLVTWLVSMSFIDFIELIASWLIWLILIDSIGWLSDWELVGWILKLDLMFPFAGFFVHGLGLFGFVGCDGILASRVVGWLTDRVSIRLFLPPFVHLVVHSVLPAILH